jgi:hypothetical protein
MKKIMTISIVLFFTTISLKAQNSTATNVTDSLNMYVGKYTFGEGSPIAELTVVVEGNKLVLKSNLGNAELEKGNASDEFTIPSYKGTAAFIRNEAKKVSGIHINAMGRVLDGEKDTTP